MSLLELSPALLFMYLFVPLGAIAVAIALTRAARHPAPIKPWSTMIVLGLMVGGTGGFGPAFLTTYGDFLEKVAGVDPGSSEGEKDYKKVADDVAAGKVEPRYVPLATALLKEKAGRDAQTLLEESMKSATPAGRTVIESVRRDLDHRSRAAAAEAAGVTANPVKVPESVDLSALPAETLHDLNTRSDAELRKFSIDPAKLRAAATRKKRSPGGP